MKPAQIIQEEKKKFERIVSDAAEKFADDTGGAITHIDIQFIDKRTINDPHKKTVISHIDVGYLL